MFRSFLVIALTAGLLCISAYLSMAGDMSGPNGSGKTQPVAVAPEEQTESGMFARQGGAPASRIVDSYLVKDAPLNFDHAMGNQNAPVVMVEYASLSCPHCADFHNKVLPELQKKYVDAGLVRYVMRHFPLNEPALKGAMLADCVGEQSSERYFTFTKVLFDAQKKWAFDVNFLSSLETFALVGGLTKDQFGKCVNDTDREIKLLKQKKQALDELRIPHTPYFFIANERFEGAHTVEDFSKFIDEKLANKQKKN